MSRRWLVALALAAGCGGVGGGPSTHDAATDGATERGPDAGAPDAAADGRDDAATLDVGGTDARDAADAPADSRDAGDARDTRDALQTTCPTTIPVVTLASSPVTGVLTGVSGNPAVSCRGGVPAQGPEAYFTLTLDTATTLDVVVAAPVDVLIAIRAGTCSDSISELACSEDAPTVDADGGVAIDGGAGSRLTGLRAPLAAGTYTIVVDTFTLAGFTRADFTMTLRAVTPRPNASCATPTVLTAGTTTMGEPLNLAGVPRALCGGNTQSALYYAVGVPAGQRLTARATPVGGDRPWMPRLEAFTACSATSCLAQGRLAAGTTQQLDWVNNGSAWQLVFLAVGADSPVNGATFNLSAPVIDLFATCLRPMTVKDGTSLPGQDLSLAAQASGQTCNGSADHAFYYAASLLPGQQLTATATPTDFNTKVPASVSIRTACDSQVCASSGQTANFVNETASDQTVLIEVTAAFSGVTGLFDLDISIPLPPAKIVVTPTSGLVTSESGGTASFTVVLASPPSADVVLGVASDTATEGKVTPASLRFTADNWRTPQTVTVTGVDDQVADGQRDYTIVTAAATSVDTRYAGLDADDVAVTNLDNEPGLTIGGALNLTTSESGMQSAFQVSLNAAPTAPVTMALSSSDIGEGTVSPALVTFTTVNWNMPQTVTLTGVDDAIVDGTQAYTIVTAPLASTDGRYNGQNPADLAARNLDDDQVAVGVKLLSGEHSCSSPQSPNVPIVVDGGGQIYIVVACETGLSLVTSTDGGATFTELAQIPGTDAFNGVAVLAAGAPGIAYLLFAANDGTAQFLRTINGGATWSAPVALSNHSDVLRLVAAGPTVFVLAPGPDGTSKMTLTRSFDGGKTFAAKSLVDGQTLDIALEPDGQTAWILNLDANEDLRKSTNAGASFTKVGDLNTDVQFHLIGNRSLFTLPNALEITKLDDPSMSAPSVSFINLPPFAMAVDDADGLTILDNDPQNRLRATHVVAGAAAPTNGRVIGPNAGSAGVAPLSRKAAAIAFVNGSILLYTTVVW